MKIDKIALLVFFISIAFLCLSTAAENGVLASQNLIAVSADTVDQRLSTATYGNWTYSQGYSIIQGCGLAPSADGGYIIAGNYGSLSRSSRDAWLLKLDSTGKEQWNQTYGGAVGGEGAYCIVNCSDGGYAFAGYTGSYGAGLTDMWLVKVDGNGTQQWMKPFGGAGNDYGMSLITTSDGGYVVVGCYNASATGTYGDFLIVKTDSSGNLEWSTTYGSSGYNYAYDVAETADGGYAVVGVGTAPYPNGDGLLVRLDSGGNLLWSQNYVGTNGAIFRNIVKTTTGFTISGTAASQNGGSNFWLVNVDETGEVLWSRTYGGNVACANFGFTVTSDGGYALTGYAAITITNYDSLLIKTDSAGIEQWNQTFGGTHTDIGYCVIQTLNGYALAGQSGSYDYFTSYWLVLTDSNGCINYNLAAYTIGNGTISPGNQTYISGTTVNLIAMAADGWTFNGWSGDAAGTSNTTITMNRNQTVTATFTQNLYNLTIITSGNGSVFPGNQSYLSGASVNLMAINADGWVFSGWSGDATGPANTTITMNKNQTITATFTQNIYTLTIITLGDGSVSPGNQSFLSGANVDLLAINADGWVFSGWSGDAQGTSNTTLVMDANKIVTATFTQNSPSPTPSSSPSPSGSSPTSNASSQPTTKPTTPSAPEFSSIILIPIVLATLIAGVLKLKQLRK